ncbi:MAG: hypothetical protein ACQEXJ_24525 [Myxococcota bacterium]
MLRRLAPALLLVLLPACDDSGEGADSAIDTITDAAGDAPGKDAGADASDAGPDVAPDAADTAPDQGDAPAPIEGTSQVYDPLHDDRVTTFPDDLWTAEDPDGLTGVRVSLDRDLPWFEALDDITRDVWEDLETLDGWGTTAAVFLSFDGPVGELPEGEETATSGPVHLLELGPDGPRRVPFLVERTPDHSILLSPMEPLRPRTRHGVVVTSDLLDANGEPISPSPTLRAILDGTAGDPRLQRMTPRYEALLEAAGVDAGDVVAATVFTTQSIVEQSSAIAADIASRSFAWTAGPDCAPEADMVKCTGTFEAGNYRDADGVVAGDEPVSTYELDAVVWLPAEGEGPWPVALFGHGLVHDKGVAKRMAAQTTPMGIAVVAIDAVAHGDHPDAPEDEAMTLFSFFAVNPDPLAVDALRLRDNFRQSTYDTLQVLRLLEEHPDVDGDDGDDLDFSRLGYLGESFGGIMSVGPLALRSGFHYAGLQLGGGRVVYIVKDSERFGIFSQLLQTWVGSADRVARLWPLLQTVVERGDASNWAAYVIGERLPFAGDVEPHVLLQLVIDDETIPDVSSSSMARAMGLSHVPPVVESVPGVPTTTAPPVAANGPGGLTLGFFQFDRITRGDGTLEEATHDYTPSSDEGRLQLRHFLETWVAGEAPEILDPYAELGTPPL